MSEWSIGVNKSARTLTFKVSVIESNTDAIQAETLEKIGILWLEEIFQELHAPSDAAPPT
jgi:hypothetical protein